MSKDATIASPVAPHKASGRCPVQLMWVGSRGGKKRLCWTPDLHKLFKDTVANLGARQRPRRHGSCLQRPAPHYVSGNLPHPHPPTHTHAAPPAGGPDAARPRAVLEAMELQGLTLHHVKSHLQVRTLRRRGAGCAGLRQGRAQGPSTHPACRQQACKAPGSRRA